MRNSIIQVQSFNNLGRSLSYGEEERLHLHFTPQNVSKNGKGKAIPFQARCGPEGG